MEIVVDSNSLNGPNIENFLKKSSRNKIVITDFLQMEAVKSVDINKTRKSFKTLKQFQNQVITLKGTEKICAMSGRTKQLKNRLIARNPNHFKDFCTLIYSDNPQHKEAFKRLLVEADVTKKYFQKLESTSNAIIGHFSRLEQQFTAHEVSELRRGGQVSMGLVDKFFKIVDGISLSLIHI